MNDEITVTQSSFLDGLEALQIYHESLKLAVEEVRSVDPDGPDLEDLMEQTEVVRTILDLFEGSKNGIPSERVSPYGSNSKFVH